MTTESTTAISRRRYPKTQDGTTPKRQKRIPEYLEADESSRPVSHIPEGKVAYYNGRRFL